MKSPELERLLDETLEQLYSLFLMKNNTYAKKHSS
jgi:hypothetical protein